MIQGEYFKIGTSLGVSATLNCQGNSLTMVANGSSRIVSPDSLEISQRLAHVPRCLHFPDGSMFTTLENEQLDLVLHSLGIAPKSSWINFFESGWHWTWLALFVIPVVLYLLFSIGMPMVAGPLASWVPETVKDDLDKGALEFLDKRVFEPSHLEPERKAELNKSFSQISRFTPFEQSDLKFRSGGIIGANALALPGGTIIFTDEIVELAEDDGELVAVFAHERGHVVNNHSMRNLMQSAGVTFVLGWMLGDLTMITDVLLVGAPVLLQQMSYSRRFEREADEYALTILRMHGYSSNCFADMMEKLATQKGRDLDNHSAYLSSHPPPRERIEASRSNQACSERLTVVPGKKPVPDKPVPPRAKVLLDPIEISPPEISEMPEIIDLTEGDYLPIRKAAPVYPREALLQGVEGYCVVEYTVTDQGKVKNPRVLADQCTSDLFVEVSIEAALKFRYKPRVVDSHAEDVKGVQNKFTFEIRSSFVPYRHEK